jgi:hypothetical protein
MKKILVFLALSIAITFSMPICSINAQEINTTEYEIIITTQEDKKIVRESFTIEGITDEHIQWINFSVQQGAEDILITVNGNSATYTSISGNQYSSNISSMEIEMDSQPNVEVSYYLEKSTENFQKELLIDSNNLIVRFDGTTIFSGDNLAEGFSLTIPLNIPSETPLPTYYVTAIILLIILLVVMGFYALKKQKTTKIKKITSESEELLTTKKAALMNILKDIEKQHRAKQISDDTYHKLKDEYKQDAVETMKKLEDIQSKV